MLLFSLCFLVGVLLLQTFAYLPDCNGVFFLFGMLICFLLFIRNKLRKPLVRTICVSLLGVSLGFTWCVSATYIKSRWTLPSAMEGQTVIVIGTIDSIPDYSDHFISFEFKLHELKWKEWTYHGRTRVRLTWRSHIPPVMHLGEKWRLKVRLKKIHGVANPGSFDFEAYAFQEGIRATGYVVDKEQQVRLQPAGHSQLIGQLRECLKRQIDHYLLKSTTSHWIPALVVGERHQIDQSQWDILRNTGTNHLMAIAGLHIGFMAGFIYFLIDRLWRIWPRLLLILPAQVIASIAALIMAVFYSALAGFSLPTQRACIMLGTFLITRLMKIRMPTWQAWSLALLTVLIVNPLSVLSESFWLSFIAVALIIYGGTARLGPHTLGWKWGRIQWVTALGLMPLCMWLFQQCSLVSFAANAIAIPWVGFCVLPLSLVGSFLLLISNKLGSFTLLMADKTLGILWVILSWLANIPWSSWVHPINTYWILLTSTIAICLFLLPAGFPGRWLGFIWALPLLSIKPIAPERSEIQFTLLDVGQGLSAIVRTKHHVLVYDAGAKLGPGHDMGESVVVPFLRDEMISAIDMVVISHGDNDHRGGVDSIMRYFPIRELRTSVPDKIQFPVKHYCLAGQSWNWDGVQFEFLYPTLENMDRGNDSSCVLSVSNGYQRLLLTGDIEKFAEKYLVENDSAKLSTTILVAPHHGSKTSAWAPFLDKVHPHYVLFPVGYRNRYHFPHASVLQKYDELGVRKMDTVSSGSIFFTMKMNSELQSDTYRHNHFHCWSS